MSSAATVEVTFVAYDIYKQEGGKLFSNSQEMLVVQLLVRMSRIVTNGGHQHNMQSVVLIDDIIPNLHTFPKELKIFDEGLEEHINSINGLFRS